MTTSRHPGTGKQVRWQRAAASCRCTRGFSLVETLVGLLIGLLGVLMIMKVATLFQERRHGAVAGSQASGQGAIAAYGLERELRRAGYALGAAVGCRLQRFLDGAPLAAMQLAPVTISANSSGGDVLVLRFGSQPAAVQHVRIAQPHPAGATLIALPGTAGMKVADQVIVFEPGRDCLLLEISAIDADAGIHHAPAASRWNALPASAGSAASGGEYTSAAALINVGQLHMTEFAVQDGNLQRRRYRPATNDWNTEVVATGILMLKAQYGFDARPGITPDKQLTSWSSNLIDANGDGIADAGDLQRIVAVRIAMLAQAGAREKPGPAGCDITTTRPQWQQGTLDGSVAAAEFPMDEISDWQCYRYQVFENIVPLRNMLWQ